MDQARILANRMMDAARTYPNDKIANEFARVGDLLLHQGTPFVKPLTDLDKQIIKFFQKNVG